MWWPHPRHVKTDSVLNAGEYNHLTASWNLCDCGALKDIYQFSRSLLSFPEITNCIFHQIYSLVCFSTVRKKALYHDTEKKSNQHRCLSFCIIPLSPLIAENHPSVSLLSLPFPCLCFVILLSGRIVFYQHLPFLLALLLPWSP